MPEADFWRLIRESIEVARGNIEKQLSHLVRSLAARTAGDIVAFELSLRDLIRKSCHYNVMALLKAIEGTVTDDGLLYFQCRLILYGRDVFYAAIADPNKLTVKLDGGMGEGEGLLQVAEDAFLRKFGENTDMDRPRDIGSTYYDYDLGAAVQGKPWDKRTHAKRYAALLTLYRTPPPRLRQEPRSRPVESSGVAEASTHAIEPGSPTMTGQQGGGVVQGWCVKCEKKVELKNPEKVTLMNKRPAVQGTCTKCGGTVFSIGAG